MKPWKSWKAVAVLAVSLAAVAVVVLGMQGGTSGLAAAASVNPSTGVGSCTLKNWNPSLTPINARNLPEGHRPQSYRPDDFNCIGAVFARPGVEFSKFPQPHNFQVIDHGMVFNAATETSRPAAQVAHAAASVNPLAPYFPPFTHFVLIYRENHTFDDYLGDCAATVAAGCNGQVESTNHISSVPDLHTLAKTYALSDAYSTGTQPPSGPNHWFLFSAQSSSSSQQQSYPTAGGTSFDRFLNNGDTGVPSQGTSACTTQPSGGSSSGNPYTFVMNGDFYWMLNSGSGFWRNPTTGNPEVLPVDRPGTTIPEELHYNEYACNGQSISDTTVMNDYESFVTADGLPVYSYVELFNDHPGSYQDIPTNDADTYNIVNFLMNNSAYKNNTVIIVTEDDTQNGNNGSDHVSNTYRVPLVVIGSPTYVKAGYVSHVAYTTANVLAAMERTMQNVKSGIIDPNDNLGLKTFPMTTADQAALGDPLEDFWVQGATPLSATASGTPTTGNAPLNVAFTGSASGGTAPYTYSWNFGDGSATSTAQNPSHTYSTAGTYTATLTVTDSASPAHTATSTVTVTVNAVGNPLTAGASGNPTSGQIPLAVAFTGTASGGTPPYSYSWNFGDGSAAATTQNPSHTYTTAGTYTATLTVTDSASPAHTATATASVTASPVQGTPPGAPTGLTATAGSGQVALSWTPPSSNGGVNITSYKVYRGTSSGSETPLTSGGCSGLGAVTSCTDSGLIAGQTYYYKVSAVNAIGEGTLSNEASATPTASTCTPAQLIADPGFESGTSQTAWTASSGVINNSTSEPPHSGSWDAWMDGYGTPHTDTLSQTVTIPAGCNSDTLSFWLHIDTANTSGAAQDTLQVQLLNSSGTVLTTLGTFSNLNANTGYTQESYNVASYAGQAITLKLSGTETGNGQTSFVTDDYALNTSGGSTGNTVTVTSPGNQTSTAGTQIKALQISASDSATGQTLTYSATGLPAGLSISSSGSITGTPTTAGSYSVTVKATDTTGASGQATFTWTVNAAGGCTAAQLLQNPGFESGPSQTAWTWTSTLATASQFFNNSSSEPPHSGTYDVWMGGWNSADTDTLAQSVTIPSSCNNATLTFWLHIDTKDTTKTYKDSTLKLDVLNSSGTVVSTPGNWSNLNAASGYTQYSVSLGSYIGQKISVRWTANETATYGTTSFVLDDTAINVS